MNESANEKRPRLFIHDMGNGSVRFYIECRSPDHRERQARTSARLFRHLAIRGRYLRMQLSDFAWAAAIVCASPRLHADSEKLWICWPAQTIENGKSCRCPLGV
jgi:hypothetical protein